MAVVNLLINGHAYPVACDSGEEERLRELGDYIDRRVQALVKEVGAQVGDTRLILMAALLIADELSEALGRVEDSEKELAELKTRHNSAEASLRDTEDALAEALESAAQQIEDIAARMAPSPSPAPAAAE
jgi:cell division protein ZapA